MPRPDRTPVPPGPPWRDAGARRRGRPPRLFGKAFESWIFHELSAHRAYGERDAELAYWRLASGIEVDFVIDDVRVALEAKGTARVTLDHLKGLREIAKDHPKVKRRIVVCLEDRPRRTEDGIEILPYGEFAAELWGGGTLRAIAAACWPRDHFPPPWHRSPPTA